MYNRLEFVTNPKHLWFKWGVFKILSMRFQCTSLILLQICPRSLTRTHPVEGVMMQPPLSAVTLHPHPLSGVSWFIPKLCPSSCANVTAAPRGLSEWSWEAEGHKKIMIKRQNYKVGVTINCIYTCLQINECLYSVTPNKAVTRFPKSNYFYFCVSKPNYSAVFATEKGLGQLHSCCPHKITFFASPHMHLFSFSWK